MVQDELYGATVISISTMHFYCFFVVAVLCSFVVLCEVGTMHGKERMSRIIKSEVKPSKN